jgi:sodium-dependent dicarboxylate transporter 2/3/5
VTVTQRRTLHTVGAPAVFLLLALSPLPGMPYPIRASIGLLVWMAWWWMAEPVHLAVTAFLPLVVPALAGFVRVETIMPAYAEPLVFLLLGTNILATLWRRWGLDRRIALVSLMGIGTSTHRQIVTWFVVAAVLSSVLPNAVVAASMMPIVVAMARFIGVEDLRKSAFASALLIAVAWGTSVGGSGTPLGGAQNLLTVQFLERRVIDHEFLFTTWVARLLPVTVVIAVASALFMRRALAPEMERVDGSRAYFAQELRSLGAMSVPERWGLALFGLAMLLAFTRQLYASMLPGLTPTFAFLTIAILSFAIRHKGEALLEWEFAQAHMVWGLIYLFAGGSALGQILSDTGTAQFVADRMVPLAAGGGFIAVVVFSFVTIVITQITSNTATIAIVVPITISAFERLGINPIPFVYIVAAAGNYGLMLPSSSAGPAIAAGYGVNLRTMLTTGLWLSVLIWILLVVMGYLLIRFWSGFGVA